MQISVMTIGQAKAAVKAGKLTDEQEKAIMGMLENLTKDEGAKIQLDQGDNAASIKAEIVAVATTMGVPITIKAVKKKNLIIVWRADAK